MNDQKNDKISTTHISEDFLDSLSDQLNSIINIPLLDEEDEKKIILILLKTLLFLIKKFLSRP